LDTLTGQARLKLCRSLSALRRSTTALTRGSLTWLDNDMPTAVLSFRRGEGKNTVVSVINISGKPLKTHVSGMAGSISPLLVTGATADAQGAFTLDAFGFFIGRNAPGNSAD
jgi:glycosidase